MATANCVGQTFQCSCCTTVQHNDDDDDQVDESISNLNTAVVDAKTVSLLFV